jgi:hypothetical protein
MATLKDRSGSAGPDFKITASPVPSNCGVTELRLEKKIMKTNLGRQLGLPDVRPQTSCAFPLLVNCADPKVTDVHVNGPCYPTRLDGISDMNLAAAVKDALAFADSGFGAEAPHIFKVLARHNQNGLHNASS